MWFDSLDQYPRWLVAAGATLVAAILIWVTIKLLKVALYVLLALVVIGGIGATLWLLFHYEPRAEDAEGAEESADSMLIFAGRVACPHAT